MRGINIISIGTIVSGIFPDKIIIGGITSAQIRNL